MVYVAIRQGALTSGQLDGMLHHMPIPDSLEREFTLRTAVIRYDDLRSRDALAATAEELLNESSTHQVDAASAPAPLLKHEALEMLALSEVIIRKAGYGRQLGVRSARVAGASWSQIGDALGTSKQSAWEAHMRWIDEQSEHSRRSGHEGLDERGAANARAVAGKPDERDKA